MFADTNPRLRLITYSALVAGLLLVIGAHTSFGFHRRTIPWVTKKRPDYYHVMKPVHNSTFAGETNQ